jgi:hypothetical protein
MAAPASPGLMHPPAARLLRARAVPTVIMRDSMVCLLPAPAIPTGGLDTGTPR